jgi:dihydrofolate synthase / folylpolyglutamate synthase
MDYQQAIGYLFNALPMYQRVGAAAYKADLENAIKLDQYFNYPHKKFKSIHIAGTNGKGSVSHILASVFQSAGYKTGLYTSPHLLDFRERIKVNGKLIDKDFVTEFAEVNLDFFKKIEASFFEMTVFMAFEYFKQNKVDIAVVEVGLGGRLDTTNIIVPELSVITNIGKDHTQFLGNSLEDIAKEKAGIIKENIPVVIGETQEEIKDAFNGIAENKNCEIYYADQYYSTDYRTKNLDSTIRYRFSKCYHWNFAYLDTDLQGIYQNSNIITSLMALAIVGRNFFTLNPSVIKTGLKQVKETTGLIGRWQEINYNPLVICDIAHNTEGISKILRQIEEMPYNKLHMVLGFVTDKKISDILNILPEDAEYYLCEPNIPRAMKIADLSLAFQQKKLKIIAYNNVNDAYKSARDHASVNDLIYVGGSTFVVADFLSSKNF